jgi:hypothetical protein
MCLGSSSHAFFCGGGGTSYVLAFNINGKTGTVVSCCKIDVTGYYSRKR